MHATPRSLVDEGHLHHEQPHLLLFPLDLLDDSEQTHFRAAVRSTKVRRSRRRLQRRVLNFMNFTTGAAASPFPKPLSRCPNCLNQPHHLDLHSASTAPIPTAQLPLQQHLRLQHQSHPHPHLHTTATAHATAAHATAPSAWHRCCCCSCC